MLTLVPFCTRLLMNEQRRGAELSATQMTEWKRRRPHSHHRPGHAVHRCDFAFIYSHVVTFTRLRGNGHCNGFLGPNARRDRLFASSVRCSNDSTGAHLRFSRHAAHSCLHSVHLNAACATMSHGSAVRLVYHFNLPACAAPRETKQQSRGNHLSKGGTSSGQTANESHARNCVVEVLPAKTRSAVRVDGVEHLRFVCVGMVAYLWCCFISRRNGSVRAGFEPRAGRGGAVSHLDGEKRREHEGEQRGIERAKQRDDETCRRQFYVRRSH